MRTTLLLFVFALPACLLGVVPLAAPREVVEQQLRLEAQELGDKVADVQAFSRYFAGVVTELQEGNVEEPEAVRGVLEASRRLHPRHLEMIEYREGVQGLAPEELVSRQLRWALRQRAELRAGIAAAAFNAAAPSLP